MYDASFDPKKAAAFAISSGSAGLFIGTPASNLGSILSPGFITPAIGVAMAPGATQLTLIPESPSSVASVLVRPSTPCFAAQYADCVVIPYWKVSWMGNLNRVP